MTNTTLLLSFDPSPAGRERAERLIDDLLAKHDLGRVTGGGQNLQSGAFDIEITTSDAETLFVQIQSALESEPDLNIEGATLIES